MIVVDNNQDPSLKKVASPPQTPQTQAGTSTPTPGAPEPPPAYPGPPPPPQPQPTYPSRSPQPLPPPPSQSIYPREVQYGEPAGKRFIKAFLVAILIYALAGMLIESIVGVATYRHRRHGSDWSFPRPERGDFDYVECSNGEEWPSSIHSVGMRKASMTFGLEAMGLFFTSSGSPSTGNVRVKEVVRRGREVRVEVDIVYSDDMAAEQAHVCRLRTTGGQKEKVEGVGIFLPEDYSRHDGHRFAVDMTIYLPADRSSQRNFAALDIMMPMYTITLDDLARNFMFDRVSLWTSNHVVDAKNLRAHNVSVITSNQRITGAFKVTKALEIHTRNAPILVDVDALNAADGVPTTVDLQTQNAPIISKLALLSTTLSESGGLFQVTGHTSNQLLSLTHAISPPDSVLHLQASTSNAPATVQLDHAYEGAFVIRTTNAKSVLARKAADDPSGKGRKRVEKIGFQRGGVVQGSVVWVGKGEDGGERDRKGEVVVESTNAPAMLVL